MKTTLRTLMFFTGAFTLFSAADALARGATLPRDAYHKRSLDLLSEKGGVDAQELESFWNQIQKSTSATRLSPNNASLNCMDAFDDTRQARNRFLSCLGSVGIGGFTPELGHEVFLARAERLQHKPTMALTQSSALLGFVEDLVREKLRHEGKDAVWMLADKGYIKGREKTSFQFQDGDVVIGLGNSSLSSIISQITNVPSRYSHAFVVRVREGQLTTIESLVQTGVRSFPLQHLIDDPYNQLTVLRWNNAKTRAQVTRKASDWSQSVADRKAEYDMDMDYSEDEKIYCSELVAKAYAYATGIKSEKLFYHRSGMEDEKIFKFANMVGVTQREYVAPGDLFNSDYFDVVAEYRKPDDLSRAWHLYLMGDLFMERLQKGHKVLPDPVFTTVPMVVWFAQLIPSIFHADARLLPKSIGPYAMSVMATTEMHIYNNAINDLKKAVNEDKSLLRVSPWEMRAQLERSLDTHTVAVLSFPKPSPENRRRPGPSHGRR